MKYIDIPAILEDMTGIEGWEKDSDRPQWRHEKLSWFSTTLRSDFSRGREKNFIARIRIDDGSVEIYAFQQDDYRGGSAMRSAEEWSSELDIDSVPESFLVDEERAASDRSVLAVDVSSYDRAGLNSPG